MNNSLDPLAILTLHLLDLGRHELEQIRGFKANIGARVVANTNLAPIYRFNLLFLNQIVSDYFSLAILLPTAGFLLGLAQSIDCLRKIPFHQLTPFTSEAH